MPLAAVVVMCYVFHLHFWKPDPALRRSRLAGRPLTPGVAPNGLAFLERPLSPSTSP